MSKDNNVIKLQVENVLLGDYGNFENEKDMMNKKTILPSQKKQPQSQSGFMAGLSAQMFMSGLGQMVGATGNQVFASIKSQGTECGFTLATARKGNPAAIATLAFKTAALAIKKITEYKQEQEELAQKYNDLTLLQLQSGQITIKSNTNVSVNKYGKLSFVDRK